MSDPSTIKEDTDSRRIAFAMKTVKEAETEYDSEEKFCIKSVDQKVVWEAF